MPLPPKFLVVDDNSDSRFLLVKTLLRKFPSAQVRESQDSDAALALVKAAGLAAVVVHRAADVDGVSLVKMMRTAHAELPIVMVSGIDRSKAALAAGANAFLSYDAWLRIGSIVAELMPNQDLATDAAPDATPAGR